MLYLRSPQPGSEWASCSSSQRVSDFHCPHCGPLSCPRLDLNGSFDGPLVDFHHVPGLLWVSWGWGFGGVMLHNTWQIRKSVWPRQNKSHFVEQLLEINFLFAFIQHVTGTEQDDTGPTCSMKSEPHFRFTFLYWECISINNFTVSGQQKCLDVMRMLQEKWV